MRKQFLSRVKPFTFLYTDVFDYNGDLRHDVFHRAYSHLKMDSTPGFPYFEYARNEEVPMSLLYTDVNNMLRRWQALMHKELSPEDELDPEVRLTYFLEGLAPPAQVFIKSEPTKKSKIARLIYGLSLMMNIVARILFGDYLFSLKSSWDKASHKVGMDMYTEEGLNRLFENLKTLYSLGPEYEVVSDDIQGWEYMGRAEFQVIWHDEYLNAAQATPFHRSFQLLYAKMERLSLVVDTDGYLHSLPFYIVYSGKVTTHAENSDERAALAEVDYDTYTIPVQTTATNGDDCLAARRKGCRPIISEHLGYVHTDVQVQTLNRINFSSQVFIHDGLRIVRVPDGVQKSTFNLLALPSQDAVGGLFLHLKFHPAFKDLVELYHLAEQRQFESMIDDLETL